MISCGRIFTVPGALATGILRGHSKIKRSGQVSHKASRKVQVVDLRAFGVFGGWIYEINHRTDGKIRTDSILCDTQSPNLEKGRLESFARFALHNDLDYPFIAREF
jgi:hypothetical protein